jgi:KDO2-lipid IV(A) lauroyltransferase
MSTESTEAIERLRLPEHRGEVRVHTAQQLARRAKKLRLRRLQAQLVFAGLALSRWSPRWLWARLCAPILACCAPPRLRRIARVQLEQAFGARYGSRERKQLVTAMFRRHACVLREIAQLRRADDAYLLRMVVPEEGLVERLRALQARGQGLIMVTPHYGNYELMPAWLMRCSGQRVGVIAKRIANPWIDAALIEMRTRYGVTTIYQEESPRKLLRLLREGGLVGILPDADLIKLQGIFVRFFGREAWTTTGAASLSVVSGAPIVPAYLTWTGEAYRMTLGDPIYPDRSAPREAEVRRITEAWTAAFEGAIAAAPDHWAWLHERWRTTPERLERRRAQGRLGSRVRSSD